MPQYMPSEEEFQKDYAYESLVRGIAESVKHCILREGQIGDVLSKRLIGRPLIVISDSMVDDDSPIEQKIIPDDVELKDGYYHFYVNGKCEISLSDDELKTLGMKGITDANMYYPKGFVKVKIGYKVPRRR